MALLKETGVSVTPCKAGVDATEPRAQFYVHDKENQHKAPGPFS